ncbi:hypothetical protein K6L09_20545 [Burkholderia cepacia]
MNNDKNIVSVQSNGITFNVRLVEQGDSYGKDNCMIHEKEDPLVEFYDSRYKKGFNEHGQFVSRYYLSTLTEPGRTGGLQLEGGIPEWSISNEGMQQVKDWLKSFNSPYFGISRKALSKEKGLTL